MLKKLPFDDVIMQQIFIYQQISVLIYTNFSNMLLVNLISNVYVHFIHIRLIVYIYIYLLFFYFIFTLTLDDDS